MPWVEQLNPFLLTFQPTSAFIRKSSRDENKTFVKSKTKTSCSIKRYDITRLNKMSTSALVQYQILLLGDNDMRENNLPKAVTRQWNGRESNSQAVDLQVGRSNHCATKPQIYSLYNEQFVSKALSNVYNGTYSLVSNISAWPKRTSTKQQAAWRVIKHW